MERMILSLSIAVPAFLGAVIYSQCISAGVEADTAYMIIRKPDVVGCPQPQASNCFSVPWAQYVLTKKNYSGKEQVDWIEVLTPVRHKSVPWWIKRENVVAVHELLEVEAGGWPLKYAYMDIGDVRALYDFDVNGNVHLRYFGLQGNQIETGHVYYAPDVMVVRTGPALEDISTLAGFDIANKKVRLECSGAEFCIYGFFSEPDRPIFDGSGNCLRECDAGQGEVYLEPHFREWALMSSREAEKIKTKKTNKGSE